MLMKIRSRISSALLLTPAIMLLLIWIARFAGPDETARLGSLPLLLWAFAVAFGMAATITLYVAYLCKSAAKE